MLDIQKKVIFFWRSIVYYYGRLYPLRVRGEVRHGRNLRHCDQVGVVNPLSNFHNDLVFMTRPNGQCLEGRKFGVRIQGFITNHTTQTLDEGLRDGFGQSLTEFLGHFGIVGLAGILKFKEGSAVNSKLQASWKSTSCWSPYPENQLPEHRP